MRKLIDLELKRFSLKGHLAGLFTANIIILFLCLFISGFLNVLGSFELADLLEVELDTITIALMLVRAVLIVWQAVFIAKIIVEEYHSKTMWLLCTYPYGRSKIIWTKLVLICIAMISFHILSNAFQHIMIYFLSLQVSFVTYHWDNLIVQLATTISTVLLALVPLAIGMARKSVIATIVSAIVIVAFSSSSQGSTAGLLSIPVIAVILGAIGAVISIITIKKMITADLN